MALAKKTEVIVTDDIDGTPGAETVVFGYNEHVWQIDLSPPNRKKFEDALGFFAVHAEPVRLDGRPVRLPGTYGSTNTVVPPDFLTPAAYRRRVRAWWQFQPADSGLPRYSAKGRVPEKVYQAYEEAQRRR